MSSCLSQPPAARPWVAATYRHQLGDYLRPALSLGLRVQRCEEPADTPTDGPQPEPATGIGDWQDWMARQWAAALRFSWIRAHGGRRRGWTDRVTRQQ